MSQNKGLPPNPNLGIDYSESELKEIWLAGGCFWGVEAYLRRIPGVAATNVGYANGKTSNPTYLDVCHQATGHAETVYVRYDPGRIKLEELLRRFFEVIDPTSFNRQGGDVGSQYRTGIYFKDMKDGEIARGFIADEQKKFKRKILVEVLPLQNYYVAEDYHQSYLEKNPGGYCHIKF